MERLPESQAGVLADAEELLASIDMRGTSRIKSLDTLIEKLQRERLSLTRVQDVAGLRFTVDDRVTQDVTAARIDDVFTAHGWSVRVVDRRDNPSHGYRAVHVIASRTGGLVEIQIRTELQNLWAQVSEKLADRVGRGIRYGLGAARGSDPMLAQLAESHRTSVADAIALHEESEQKQNLAEQNWNQSRLTLLVFSRDMAVNRMTG